MSFPKIVTATGMDTEFGRIGTYSDGKVGALVEVLCESAPVAGGPDCRQFADDLAKQLATGPGAATVDVVFSAYALHHLSRLDKETVLSQVVELLAPGGWFVNADLIVANSVELETRLQQIRIAGIVERTGGADGRFADSALTRQFLADLELQEADQPLTLAEDLALLRSSGLKTFPRFGLNTGRW